MLRPAAAAHPSAIPNNPHQTHRPSEPYEPPAHDASHPTGPTPTNPMPFAHAAAKRRRAVDRDEARRLLTSGLPACTHCRPDQHLGIHE
ncbi:DUF6233 domain-containing protein [Streptomyces sp. NPDC001102]